MAEPTLLGMTKNEWDLYYVLGSWLSAVGTLATVIVALYLANRTSRHTAKVSISSVIMFSVPTTKSEQRFIQFSIVNTGERPIRIEQIGWRAGLFRRSFVVQGFDRANSSAMPIDLSHGQKAKWMVPLNEGSSWEHRLAEKLLSPAGVCALWSLRGIFHTTIRRTFSAKPGASIVTKLREALSNYRTSTPE